MMREVMTESAMEETFAGLPDVILETFGKEMGITLWNGDAQITLEKQILLLALYAIIAIVVAAWVSKRRKIHDR